jgi:hypothetical protein
VLRPRQGGAHQSIIIPSMGIEQPRCVARESAFGHDLEWTRLASRAAPIVTVLDGHPHTPSFLSAIRRMPVACLGVSDFGQPGDVADLYHYFGIDAETIVGAALDLLDAEI